MFSMTTTKQNKIKNKQKTKNSKLRKLLWSIWLKLESMYAKISHNFTFFLDVFHGKNQYMQRHNTNRQIDAVCKDLNTHKHW